jgi:hypothetical protein
MGADLEFADQATLARAMEGRRNMWSEKLLGERKSIKSKVIGDLWSGIRF